MPATQLGTSVQIGVGMTLGSYIVSSVDPLDFDIKEEDIIDEDNILKTNIIYQAFPLVKLELIPLANASPEYDFPKGFKSKLTGYTGHKVIDVSGPRVPGARKVTVTLKDIGI